MDDGWGGIIAAESSQEKTKDVKYRALQFDGNATPMTREEDRSMASVMTSVAGETWDNDASVASEGVEAPLRRKHYRWVEGVEREIVGRL
ncbi:hypothetical protein TrLO_g11648 [Triparma laevis f. longispina]|uniref:Uncharacterized protein n=1 Tax=Triparma laevis f. longispina TaxID=1714387 RepID=A0A9W7F9C6_9STRA|nr:hypothetical protein TrLO_g11648 [Triparma laevis f. longispina]